MENRCHPGCAWVLLFLVPIFSGCLSIDASRVTIPYPSLGDRVSFLDEVSGANFTYEVQELVSVWLPIGKEIPTARIRVDGYSTGGSTLRLDYYVNLLDNALYKFVNLCLEAESEGCTSLRQESLLVKGSPWGFGSSLVQGESVSEKSELRRELAVNGYPAQVQLTPGKITRLEDRARVELSSHASVEGSWTPPIATSAFEGSFVVEDGNPYAVEARFDYSVWNVDSTHTVPIQVRIKQVDFIPGTGGTIPWKGRPPPTEFPCFSQEGAPVVRGLPPGADRVVGQFQSSFREFADYLESAYPDFKQRRDAPGFYISFLQMKNGTVIRMANLVEDRTVVVDVRYHDDNHTLKSVRVEKRFLDPNPLNRPPQFSYKIEDSRATVVPRHVVPPPPVPFNKVYNYDNYNGPPSPLLTIEVAPGPHRMNGEPLDSYYEFQFWKAAGGNALSLTTYDGRTGCPLSRAYQENG